MRSISTRRLYPRLLSGSKIGFVRLGGPECSIAAVWNNSNLQFVPARGVPIQARERRSRRTNTILKRGANMNLPGGHLQGDTIRNAVPIPMSDPTIIPGGCLVS